MVAITTQSVLPMSPTTSCLSGRSDEPYRVFRNGFVGPIG